MSKPTSGLHARASAAWTRVGAWTGGTVASVALTQPGQRSGSGLVACRVGVFEWDGRQVTPAWQGISDPSVSAVAYAGATALAATESGRLYRRPAQGDGDWQEIAAWAGLGTATVLAPSPDFGRDGVLLVGTDEGIFRTMDGGDGWESCDFGLLDSETLCLACAPDFSESRLVWAGSAGGGLYRSRNAGRAWRESGSGLPDTPVQALVVAPDFAQSRTLYVGLEDHGVFVSHDGGESWSPFGRTGVSVNCLAMGRDGRLWAGCGDGLHVADAHGNWTRLDAPVEIVLSLAARGETLALGAYGEGVAVSVDGGKSWQMPELALHAPPLLASASATDWIALDADGLVAHSTDGGVNWRSLPSPEVNGVFGIHGRQNAAGEPVYFAATGIGLCRWDGDAGWSLVADAPFVDHTALAVELSPTYAEDATLLVVGHDGALLLSTDQGETWRELAVPWSGQALLQAHFVPSDHATQGLLALSAQPTESGHFAIALWQCDDLGQTWETLAGLTSGVPAVVMSVPQDGMEQAIFLATQHRVVKIYRPGGGDDHAVHQHFFDPQTRVTALAASPTYAQDGVVWAATSMGLMRSADHGESWERAGDLPDGLPIMVIAAGMGELRAVTLGGQVWQLQAMGLGFGAG